MTVLFSVNTEKVHLRKESILEVYGETEEELGCGKPPRANSRGCSPGSARLRQTAAESCRGDRGRLPPAAPRARPPQGESTRHPRNLIRYVRMGSAVRGGAGLAKAVQLRAVKGIKSWPKDQKVRGDPRPEGTRSAPCSS